MCKNKYKNSSASTLYLLRKAHEMTEKSKGNIKFIEPALDLQLAIHRRYHA